MEQKHKDKLREFVARSGGSKGEGLLAEMNKLMEYLFEHNLAYRTTVRCSVVGVHPQNRDGMGVSCHHGSWRVDQEYPFFGFRPKQSQHASGRDVARHQRNWGSDQVQWKDDYGIQWPSPICWMWWPFALLHHTRFSYQHGRCRSLFYGAASDDAALTDSAGNLEMSRIGAQWQAAIKSGMECTVLTSAVATTNPEIISLLQASGNAVQQISKEEDEIQVSNRIIQAIHSYQSLHGKPPLWSDISNHVLRSQPKCKEAAPSIFLFSLKYSAGDAFLDRDWIIYSCSWAFPKSGVGNLDKTCPLTWRVTPGFGIDTCCWSLLSANAERWSSLPVSQWCSFNLNCAGSFFPRSDMYCDNR